MKRKSPFPEERTHRIGDKTYTIKPMSFFDLVELPQTLLGAVLQSVPVNDTGKIAGADVMVTISGYSADLVAEQIGCAKDDLKAIPADQGAAMVADWMELNLTENFLKALVRIVRAGKQISSSWSSL